MYKQCGTMSRTWKYCMKRHIWGKQCREDNSWESTAQQPITALNEEGKLDVNVVAQQLISKAVRRHENRCLCEFIYPSGWGTHQHSPLPNHTRIWRLVMFVVVERGPARSWSPLVVAPPSLTPREPAAATKHWLPASTTTNRVVFGPQPPGGSMGVCVTTARKKPTWRTREAL